MEEKKKELLPLVKEDTTFKIVIPLKVEQKIRLLCREIHNVEWSGILFYTVSGSFNNKDLVIECQDIFQMDEGSGGYTEYYMSPDVASYLVDHPELCGCYQGLIHSHNNMATFFSGTDTNTLRQEGNDMAHFVSLIVNNAGTYSAAITRQATIKSKVSEDITYPTWNGKEESDTDEYECEEKLIQRFDLEIDKQDITDPSEEEMLARIKEIRDKKTSSSWKSNKTESWQRYPWWKDYHENPQTVYTAKPEAEVEDKKPEPKEQKLPFRDDYIDYEFPIDEDVVNGILYQLITGSPFMKNSKSVKIDSWSNNIETVYGKRFPNSKKFDIWAADYIDFLLNDVQVPDIEKYMDRSEVQAVIAYKVSQKLSKLKKNEYIDSYLDILSDYIV